jgi:hypothetical protein
MINLKRFNYFSGEESAVGKAVYQICQMHELAGEMAILFHNRNGGEIGLHHSLQPAHTYRTYVDLSTMLADEGILFRADIVVIDAWKMKSDHIDQIVDQVKSMKICFIIIAQSYHVVVNSENMAEYTAHSNLVEGKYRSVPARSGFGQGIQIPIRDILIKSKTDGWSATTDDLKASFIRDKRLDDLLGE